jgi:hypothetical protein
MRAFLVVFALVAGCGPGAGDMPSSPPVYLDCSPIEEPTLTALAIGHTDGRVYTVGDAPDIIRGGQGLSMTQFSVRLTGTVPGCIAPSIGVEGHADYNRRSPTPVDGGASFVETLGPVDASDFWIQVRSGGLTAMVQVSGGVVQSIE